MAYQTVKSGGYTRQRFIPDNAITVEHPDGLGICYVERSPRGYTVRAYAGNAAKASFYELWRDIEKAHERIERFFDGLSQHKQLVADRRKQDYAPHTLKVGDIITNSWGYDQTNVDWYVITRTSEHYVWLKPIAGSQVDSPEGLSPMSGMCEPKIDTTSDDPTKWGIVASDKPATKHRASGSNVSMKFGCGSKWDGRARYESWYA